jgi:hypothetical protein
LALSILNWFKLINTCRNASGVIVCNRKASCRTQEQRQDTINRCGRKV